MDRKKYLFLSSQFKAYNAKKILGICLEWAKK